VNCKDIKRTSTEKGLSKCKQKVFFCLQILSHDVPWYPMLSMYNFTSCSMISYGVLCFHMMVYDVLRCPILNSAVSYCPKISPNYIAVHVVLWCFIMSHVISWHPLILRMSCTALCRHMMFHWCLMMSNDVLCFPMTFYDPHVPCCPIMSHGIGKQSCFVSYGYTSTLHTGWSHGHYKYKQAATWNARKTGKTSRPAAANK
jgi:hypothetical protein